MGSSPLFYCLLHTHNEVGILRSKKYTCRSIATRKNYLPPLKPFGNHFWAFAKNEKGLNMRVDVTTLGKHLHKMQILLKIPKDHFN